MKYTKTLGAIALSSLLMVTSGYAKDTEFKNENANKNASKNSKRISIPASSTLDKAYVPSLFYSNVPAKNASFVISTNEALQTLKSEWEAYKSTLGNKYRGQDLTGYFTDVDSELDLADSLLKDVLVNNTYPANISAAHEALESVRDILGAMREDINLNHFMDYVTEAHHKMEPVAGASSKYTAGDITLEQLCTNLESSLPTFTTSWEALQNEYDESTIAALYNMSTPKSTNMSTIISTMSNILTSLTTALPGCTENVAASAGKVKPVFVKMFLGFGNFITPFEDKMIAMEKGIVSGLYCTNNPPDVVPTCGGLEGTQALIADFETLSNTFQAQYPVIPGKLNLPGVIYWSSYFTTIKSAVAHAKSVASSAQTTADLVDAHEDFETIRVAMYDLRSTYENFAFVMDRVTDYHGAMGKIAKAVGIMDYSAIATALPKAQSTMLAMEESVNSMDFAAFGFDVAWHTKQIASVAFQSQNLSNLEFALNKNDEAAILEYGKLVKPKFVGFFKAFGAF